MDYQWYPGHMTKARRMMEENIKIVDLVIEICDARVPFASRNPEVDELAKGKGRIVIFTKYDLSDPDKVKVAEEKIRQDGTLVIHLDARTRKDVGRLKEVIAKACAEKVKRDRARGILNRPVKAMIVGVPNVGKSTMINSLSGRNSAKTGNKPGVTKGKQWISFKSGDSSFMLLDTPGILWPKFENQEIGLRLALTGAINGDILDETELSLRLLSFLCKEYPANVEKQYNVQIPAELQPDDMMQLSELLGTIAAARNLFRAGGEVDVKRMSALLIDDFRAGRIGRISLE